MAELFDFSYDRLSPTEVKTAGRVGVIRYVASGRPEVSATRAEVDSFRAAGMPFAAVWQRGATRSLGGRPAGLADAADAAAYIAGLGAEPGDPVHFAVDFNPTPAQYPTILAYLQGCAEVLGWPRVGVYANAPTIDYLTASSPTRLFWLHNWGSGGRVPAAATLHQYAINQTVGGKAVDFDRTLADYYGQWGTPVGTMLDLPAALRAAGLNVWVAPDWRTNGHDYDLIQPFGGVLHHTAGYGLRSVYGEPDARPDVPQPRAALWTPRPGWVAPDGKPADIAVICAGRAWQAGAGRMAAYDDLRAGRFSVRTADAVVRFGSDSDDIDAGWTSLHTLGNEVESLGTPDAVYPDRQLDVVATSMWVCVDLFRWPGFGCWAHHRQLTYRKPDMSYRGDLWGRAASIAGGDDMPTIQELNDAAANGQLGPFIDAIAGRAMTFVRDKAGLATAAQIGTAVQQLAGRIQAGDTALSTTVTSARDALLGGIASMPTDHLDDAERGQLAQDIAERVEALDSDADVEAVAAALAERPLVFGPAA